MEASGGRAVGNAEWKTQYGYSGAGRNPRPAHPHCEKQPHPHCEKQP